MGSQDESSLAARRARLRGSLAKQALPPDPYSQDPYARAKTPDNVTEAKSAPEHGHTSETSSNGSNGTNGTANDPQHGQPGFRLEDLASGTSSTEPAASTTNPIASEPPPQVMPSTVTSGSNFGLGSLSESLKGLSRTSFGGAIGGSSSNSALTEIADWSAAEPEKQAVAEPEPEKTDSTASAPQDDTNSNSFFAAEAQSDSFAAVTVDEPAAKTSDPDFFSQMSSPSKSQTVEALDALPPEIEPEPEPAIPAVPAEDTSASPATTAKESKSKKSSKSTRVTSTADDEDAASAPPSVLQSEPQVSVNLAGSGQMHVIVDKVAEPTKVLVDQPAHVIVDKIGHTQVLDTLTNIDQAMGACAMNLSALQSTATQQTEALRSLSETLQTQTFSELGMTLNGLMESLSAALEPMKAVSELVPAIDQLVQTMETKIKAEPTPEEKLSPDQLVMNLADQLSAGQIDPWTFKCAYMAVFPSDHPADLLHRLVDLLGTSRLSGNLFRAAYDAVQAPDPPKRVPVTYAEDGNTVVKVVQDEALVQQLDELRKSQQELERKMSSRENELTDMLSSKDQELQEAQDLLNSRWEEFNSRYDELSESLQKRDELIQEKESELARKENENGRLRNQMDELKDMVTELKNQFSASKARADALSKPGFFDSAPTANAAPSLFDAAPNKPLFQGDPQQHAAPQHQQQAQAPLPMAQQQPQPQMQVPMQQQMPVPMPQPPAPPQPEPAQPPGMATVPPQMAPAAAGASQQAIPGRQNQMTTPFAGAGPGSYGSGVRAQVFEVIVRQALAGAPWREICAGPMQVNNISPDEVEAEVKRRQALLKK
jgi:hypothetical protein